MTRTRLILLALALTAAAASGRVFERLGPAPFDPGGGHPAWARAYAAEWTLNGADAAVEVWSASEPLAAALDRMRAEAARRGAIAALLAGEAQAWGAVSGNGRVTRVFCTTAESGRQTLVFLFSQTDEEFRESLKRDKPVRLPGDLAPPPGARPVFTAASRDSGTSYAVFTTAEGPAEARAFMARSLAASGWTPVAGPAAGTAGPAAVYARGGALCGFGVKMSGQDGSCAVTVFHRRLDADHPGARP